MKQLLQWHEFFWGAMIKKIMALRTLGGMPMHLLRSYRDTSYIKIYVLGQPITN